MKPPSQPLTQKRQKRLHQKRISAKTSRQKQKNRLNSLEMQVNRLNDELHLLQTAQNSVCPALLDEVFREEHFKSINKLAELVGNPQATEEEIKAELLNWHKKLAVLRGEMQQMMFYRTVEMMIPGHISQSLCLCDIEAFPEFQSLLRSFPLSPSQLSAFHASQLYFHSLKPELTREISAFKSTADEICSHVNRLQDLILSILSLTKPRQCALFAMWFTAKYAGVDVEKVLNYGHNTMEVLNEEGK